MTLSPESRARYDALMEVVRNRMTVRAFDASARFASDVISDGPVYGQVNLLTATPYDDAGEMVAFGRPTGVAFFAVGAPVGEHGDWSARAAMNSGTASTTRAATGPVVVEATNPSAPRSGKPSTAVPVLPPPFSHLYYSKYAETLAEPHLLVKYAFRLKDADEEVGSSGPYIAY